MKTTEEEVMGEEIKPARWYEAGTGNHQGLIIDEATGRNVAVAYDKKDAPLIAAAPDLLYALRRMMATIGKEDSSDSVDACHAARRAIAKAEENQ